MQRFNIFIRFEAEWRTFDNAFFPQLAALIVFLTAKNDRIYVYIRIYQWLLAIIGDRPFKIELYVKWWMV